MTNDSEISGGWLAVIGKSLAYLCLQKEAGEQGLNLQQKAQFLEGLGVGRSEVAAMLGTSAASISELHRQAKKKRIGRSTRASATKKNRH